MPQALEDELQNFIKLVSNVTEAYTAALFLVDEKQCDSLRLQAWQSLSNNIAANVEIPVGNGGLVGWVAKEERPTNASKFPSNTTTLQFYTRDEEIKSFAASPIFDGTRLIGVLSIDSKKNYVFTDKVMKLLNDFAITAGGIIVHGRRRIKLSAEATAMDALNEIIDKITVCGKISELAQTLRLSTPNLIPHDYLAIALRSYDNDKFHMVQTNDSPHGSGHLPLTHFRMGWVIQQARTIYIPDLKEAHVYPGCGGKWRSFIGAPLMVHDQVTGAIGLMSRKPKAFRQVDKKSLTILTAACSSAFTSLYLHNKSKYALVMDHLTRVCNHRHVIESHGSLKKDGAVAITDVLGFSRVNQEIGLEGGDTLLYEIAQRLKAAIGETGVVARYYGDRFIILLDGLKKEDCLKTIRSAVDSIQNEPFLCKGVQIICNTVAGVAFCPSDGRQTEELIAKANLAAEHAKQEPGASVVIYDKQEPAGGLRSVTGK